MNIVKKLPTAFTWAVLWIVLLLVCYVGMSGPIAMWTLSGRVDSGPSGAVSRLYAPHGAVMQRWPAARRVNQGWVDLWTRRPQVRDTKKIMEFQAERERKFLNSVHSHN